MMVCAIWMGVTVYVRATNLAGICSGRGKKDVGWVPGERQVERAPPTKTLYAAPCCSQRTEYMPWELSRRSSFLSGSQIVMAVYDGVKERMASANQREARRSGRPDATLSFNCRYISPAMRGGCAVESALGREELYGETRSGAKHPKRNLQTNSIPTLLSTLSPMKSARNRY